MASLPDSMQAIHIAAFVKAGIIYDIDISADPSGAQSHEELKVTKIPVPKTDKHSLVVRTTHVSPAYVDLLYARGLHQNNKRHAKPPFILGMDFAGVVHTAPQGSRFTPGDRVYGSNFGAYSEYIVIDTKKGSAVRKVPKRWSLAEACSVGASGATSLGCFLRAGPISQGKWVLITGATGGLGTMAVQIAKRMGAKVIALVGKDKAKQQMLKDIGADALVRYDRSGWEDKVKEISGGGVDLVYDAVGMVESCLKCCGFAGRVVIVGFAGRTPGDIEKVRMNRILLKGAAVMGYRFGEHGRQHPEEVAEVWRDFDAMVEEGGIKAVVYEQKYLGIDSVTRALTDLADHKVWGRAVVQIADEDDAVSEKSRL